MNLAPATLGLMAFGFVLYAMAGCSKNSASAKTESAKMTGTAPAVADSVCDRHILRREDVGGILSSPITGTKPLPGDAQSCEFSTDTFPAIIISVRPGLGRTTVDAWTAGKMPLESRPVTGIGDAAVWLETLHEVIAQKNAILCDIEVRGGGSDIALSAGALPAAVGALCNKIFSAY